MQWLCVRLNRSYSNRSVWSAHKGRALAHKLVEAWGTKQCTLVSLLFHWPAHGLPLSHTLGANFYTKLRKPFSSGKQQWNYWRLDLFGNIEALMSWQDKTLCALFLSFFFPLLSLSLSFSLLLEICPVQQLSLAVWLKMIWIYPVVRVRCGPGAAVGSPSPAENPPLNGF